MLLPPDFTPPPCTLHPYLAACNLSHHIPTPPSESPLSESGGPPRPGLCPPARPTSKPSGLCVSPTHCPHPDLGYHLPSPGHKRPPSSHSGPHFLPRPAASVITQTQPHRQQESSSCAPRCLPQRHEGSRSPKSLSAKVCDSCIPRGPRPPQLRTVTQAVVHAHTPPQDPGQQRKGTKCGCTRDLGASPENHRE